ncbi:MAG: VIT1/CCC1 transporter family protein [Steroidobacterales bacterium]
MHPLEHDHTPHAIRERFAAAPPQSYLRDWVYGGVDGAVTMFAIVSGVVGARLSPGVIVILGLSNLVADGLAMAASNYLATRSEHDEFRHAEAIEHRHIGADPVGEREEVREIFRRYGIHADLLEQVVEAVTADREQWLRIMLREEYGLPAVVRMPSRAAISTFVAFVICGLVPLAPFVAGVPHPFGVAITATALEFALIGALKSRWSTQPGWRSALETVGVGGAAAAVAYVVGAALRGFSG